MQTPGQQNTDRPLAVITGASSGIGRVIAHRVAQRGYRTVLIARRLGRIESLAAELSQHAPSRAVAMDLADAELIEPAITELIAREGGVDLLINNAGYGVYGPFLQQSEAVHRRLMQVNYFAPLILTRQMLPGMLERGTGQVINIASVCVKMGPWGHAGYAASKAALVAMTQCLAAEHGERVSFSYVLPGLVSTDFFQEVEMSELEAMHRGKFISAERVADRVVRLLDRPKLEVCIPRHYALLDFMRAISVQAVHQLVKRSSRPPASV